MATKHVSQESLKNSNVNPVSGVDRLGRTPEEAEADQQEMLKRQYEAGRPFSDAGLAVQRALQGYSGLHDGWGAKPLVGDEGRPNTVDGVYELGRFMARARQEAEYASRDTKDYEQAFIGHMETVADKYNGLTNLDEDALNASKPGEKDDPAQIHIAAVLEKLNVSGVEDGETSSWQIAGLAPGDKFTVEQKDTEGNYVYKDLSLRELREMNENGGTEPVAA